MRIIFSFWARYSCCHCCFYFIDFFVCVFESIFEIWIFKPKFGSKACKCHIRIQNGQHSVLSFCRLSGCCFFFTSTHFNFQLYFKMGSCIRKKNYSLHSFSWIDVEIITDNLCVKWNETKLFGRHRHRMVYTQSREIYFNKFRAKCWWKETIEFRILTLYLARNWVYF